MKILLVHNHYQQSGGEDQVFLAEKKLLEEFGHEVLVYERTNDEIANYSSLQRLSLAGKTIWAKDSRADIYHLLEDHKPAVAHFHNTFPLISPSVYSLCHSYGVGVVQTLHNFRYLCPNALFFRDGRACEDCLGKIFPWPGILHACYRDSRVQTAVTGAMIASHRLVRTLQNQVDQFIVLSNFARNKFVEGGLPVKKIVVKPNFVHPDPGIKSGDGHYFLYVGRLSPEKGVLTLLKAIQRSPELPLRIVGDGPLMEEIKEFIRSEDLRSVDVCGRLSREETLNQIKGARAVVFPSECYENFPLVVAEAYACGVPVIASRLGGTKEIVQDGKMGILFSPGSVDELASGINTLWSNPDETRLMGKAARKVYETEYSAEVNYRHLIQIYERVLDERKQ